MIRRHDSYHVASGEAMLDWSEPRQRYGLIIQPGAIGDTILTLPLVRLLRHTVGLNRVDMMGHPERLGLLRRRSDAGHVLDLESARLHRLFGPHGGFDLPEGDPLIEVFQPYEVIITFLGEPGEDFERNLAYTAHLTHAAEVVTLPLRPAPDGGETQNRVEKALTSQPPGQSEHVAHHYLRRFAQHWGLKREELDLAGHLSTPLLQLAERELSRGRELLAGALGRSPVGTVVVHPGSGGRDKCWPLKDFRALMERLRGEGRPGVWLIGPAEEERWSAEMRAELASAGPVLAGLSLTEVAAVVAAAGIFVGNDSGISHLAGALAVATVAIFGPASTAAQWRPLGASVTVLEGYADWPTVDNVWQSLLESLTH